jgi:hypothetical protein
MAVNEESGNFPSVEDAIGDVVVAVEDAIFLPLDPLPPPREPCGSSM